MEHQVIYERNLLKERQKDDHMFEGKEKFVTSAYKEKVNRWTFIELSDTCWIGLDLYLRIGLNCCIATSLIIE